MTEAEWLVSSDLAPMLEYLRGKVNERKLRLLACACCRHIWDMLVEEGHDAIEASESYADGVIGDSELANARNRAKLPQQRSDVIWQLRNGETQRAMQAAVMVAWGRVEPWKATMQVLQQARSVSYASRLRQFDYVHANTLRCMFGNPFRLVTFNFAWLTPTVKQLAALIYDERQWDKMPLLGDALMDARCNNEDVLKHCRGGGEHVRGCWVVDLVLGRE